MLFRAHLCLGKGREGWIFRFAARPLALVAVAGALFFLLLLAKNVVDFAWDSYFPYEGRVVKIESRWVDRLTSESSTWEHLTIETPEGETLDRLVSLFVRSNQCIQVGDDVVKRRGFGEDVRPRDKKTSQESIQEWKDWEARKGRR